MDQDDVEEFLAVGKALRINGLNAKEQEQKEQNQDQDTMASTPSIKNIKEEVFQQGDNDDNTDCFKYTSETILGSSSGNNNERRGNSKTALRKHKQIDYLELAGTQQFKKANIN